MALYLDFELFEINSISNNGDIEDTYYQKIVFFLNQIVQKDAIFEVYTSGSTGIPKKIIFNQEQAFKSASLSNNYFGINSNSVLFLPINIDFIGAKMLLARAFIAKAKIWIISPKSSVFNDFPDNIKIDFISITPYQLSQTIDIYPHFFSNIKKCLIGGSSINAELKLKIKNLNTSCEFFESFGMSETLSHFAIKKLNSIDDFFHVLPEYKIKVLEDGRLSITCPFLEQEIHSNDIVELVSPDSFIFIGRKDYVVNSGGIKIHPELLEKVLESKFNFPFYFSKIDDELFGEALVLNILDNNLLSDNDIMNLCQKEIHSKYYLPKKIFRHSKFKYNQNGKLRRI